TAALILTTIHIGRDRARRPCCTPMARLSSRSRVGEAMFTLYGKKGSGSATTQIGLEIAGAPYRIVETASWEPNDAFQELLRVNPLGQIPTLVLPDGSVLSESAAILIHLGSVYPDSGLLPRDHSARAQVVRGMVFIAAYCYAAISVIDFPER